MHRPLVARVCSLLLLLLSLLQRSEVAAASLQLRGNIFSGWQHKSRRLAAALNGIGDSTAAAGAATEHKNFPIMRLLASGPLRSIAAAATTSRQLRLIAAHQQQQPHLQPHQQLWHHEIAAMLPSSLAHRFCRLGWQQPKRLLGSSSSRNTSKISTESSSENLCARRPLRSAAKGYTQGLEAATGETGATDAAAAAAAAHASLCSRLTNLSRAYYSGEEPLASDEEFDALWLQLKRLEQKHPQLRRPDSPLQRIGAGLVAGAAPQPAAAAAACEHISPVLSLESVHSPAEANSLFRKLDRFVIKALQPGPKTSTGRRRRREDTTQADAAAAAAAGAAAARVSGESDSTPAAMETSADAFAAALLMEPKIDGQSVSLTYELIGGSTSSSSNSGSSSNADSSSSDSNRSRVVARYRLVRALTRGDGRQGEDITAKALQLGRRGSLPLEIEVSPAAAVASAAAAAAARATATEATEGAAAGTAASRVLDGFIASPQRLEVRGEAFVSLSSLLRLNRDRKAKALKPFASSRHAVVGLLRRLEIAGEEDGDAVRFCAYGLVGAPCRAVSVHPMSRKEESRTIRVTAGAAAAAAAAAVGAAAAGVSTQLELLQRLQQWGFDVPLPHTLLVNSYQEALRAFQEQSRAHAVYVSQLQGILRGGSAEAAANAAAGAARAAAPCAAAVAGAPSRGDATAGAAAAVGAVAAKGPRGCRHPVPLEDIPCDGVVYKLNVLHLQQQLGSTSRAPRWAFALKFAAAASTTTVLGVEWTVGSSGVCTPVALLQPVLLGGVSLSRASLHSPQELRRKDVRVGDRVYVQLKGESVPQIAGVDRQARTRETAPVSLPTCCPSCGRTLMERPMPTDKKTRNPKHQRSAPGTTEGDASATPAAAATCGRESAEQQQEQQQTPFQGVLWCPGGWACGAQRLQRLLRFFSREGVAVSGLGPRALEVLIARGCLGAPSDAFYLEEQDRQRVAAGELGLADWPGWGPQARDALFQEIEQVRTKGVLLQQLLFALGVPGMGKKAAAAVAQQAKTLSGFLAILDSLRGPPNQTPRKAQEQGNPINTNPQGQAQRIHEPSHTAAQYVKTATNHAEIKNNAEPQPVDEPQGGTVTHEGLSVPQEGTGGPPEGMGVAPGLDTDWVGGIEPALLEELRTFAQDGRNRQQLLQVAKALPVHPVAGAGGGGEASNLA